MAETEYKNYDSDDEYVYHNATLAFDPRVADGSNGPIVSIKFASTCRSDRYQTMWVEATVNDYQANLARHLKKGDSVTVKGKPGQRPWQDKEGVDRVSFEILRADLKLSKELRKALKERGFVRDEKPNAKGAGKGAKGKAATKPVGKRTTIVEIPDDEPEDSDTPEDDSGDTEE